MTIENQKTQSISALRLWQLISPALPIGAYSYSQGLEYAYEAGWISDEKSAERWIIDLIKNNLCNLDIPVLLRIFQAWQRKDFDTVIYWNEFILACRETSELKKEDIHLGTALQILLKELNVTQNATWPKDLQPSFVTMFALASVHWQILIAEAANGLVWAWCENQVAAAIKTVPLGQTAGQRILSAAIEVIPDNVEAGLQLTDDQIGTLAPAFAIGSALHETQYTRLFRS